MLKFLGLQKNPEAPVLDNETNNRACLIVIEGVSRMPQTYGSAIFVAESLMSSFENSNSSVRDSVTISEMAEIVPDRRYCMEKVHDIHRSFGIDYLPPAKVVESMVIRHALEAMVRIAFHTRHYSFEFGMKLPSVLDYPFSPFLKYPQGPRDLTTVSHINKPYAYALQDFLEENLVVREKVSKYIFTEAENARLETDRRRNEVRSNYLH